MAKVMGCVRWKSQAWVLVMAFSLPAVCIPKNQIEFTGRKVGQSAQFQGGARLYVGVENKNAFFVCAEAHLAVVIAAGNDDNSGIADHRGMQVDGERVAGGVHDMPSQVHSGCLDRVGGDRIGRTQRIGGVVEGPFACG